MRRAARAALVLAMLALPLSAAAQERVQSEGDEAISPPESSDPPASESSVPSGLSIGEGQALGGFTLPDIPVLTIEADRIFAGTRFGQRINREIATMGKKIAGENRRIEAELEEEESRLTALRADMSPEEFRALADAFDTKVRELRDAQDAKVRRLTQTSEEAQRLFLQAIAPILEALMIEQGASVILDRRAVFLSADASDITETAIARIDASLGDGSALLSVSDAEPALPPASQKAPQSAPQTDPEAALPRE